jgi:hypothetical protein
MKQNKKDVLARMEANIGLFQSFFSYLNSYQEAFQILVGHIKKSQNHIDTIAYPCLFLVRHSLELGFKVNIKFFSKYSNKKDHIKSTSHNLKHLFNAFKLHVNSAISELQLNYSIIINKNDLIDFNRYCKEVDLLVNTFDLLDQTSESFRYPVTRKNKPVFNNIKKINLLDIEDLFDKSMILLRFTSSVIGQYTQELDYMNEVFENELRNSIYQ